MARLILFTRRQILHGRTIGCPVCWLRFWTERGYRKHYRCRHVQSGIHDAVLTANTGR